MSCAFDCDCHPALMLGAIAVSAGGINFIPSVKITRKSSNILIIDLGYLGFAKIAFFSHWSEVFCHVGSFSF